MASNISSYKELYNKTLKMAEWYKQPQVRTAFKITGIASIVALVVIASISAHARSHPLASVGAIRRLSQPGLKALTAAGFIGSAVGYWLLKKYLNKSQFKVSDYLEEDRSVLYVVKDQNGQVKAYLYGTVHVMSTQWKGLNDQVKNKLQECRKVIVECHSIKVTAGQSRALHKQGIQPGADFQIIDYARHSSLVLEQFETQSEHEEFVNDLVIAQLLDGLENFQCSSCFSCCFRSTSLVAQEAYDPMVVAWQMGHEQELSMSCTDHVTAMGRKTKETFRTLVPTRNMTWMKKIKSELNRQEPQPVFIAVGYMHLFDNDSLSSTGLNHLIRDAGWVVERVPA